MHTDERSVRLAVWFAVVGLVTGVCVCVCVC